MLVEGTAGVFLHDITARRLLDPIYSDFFPDPLPTRCCIAASALPFGARVEIEAVAHVARP